MIDVLKKLEQIAEDKPELVADALKNVKATNPMDVKADNSLVAGKEVEAPFENSDLKQEYAVGSYKDFLSSKGVDIYNLKGNDHVKYSQMYKAAKDKAHSDATMKKGSDDHKSYTPSTKDTPAKIEDETNEGGMSDIHIGAQEAIGEFTDEDGNLTMPKRDVVKALVDKSKTSSFPASYEYETAARMVADDFDDNGEPKADMEPAIDSEQPADEGNEFAQAVQKAKAAGMKAGDKFKVGDKEYTLKDSDFEVNTNTMENKKETIKESIQISADGEAGMMLQILKLAGIEPKPVTPDMIGADEPKEMPPQAEPEHDEDEMAKLRDIVTKPEDEKAEETFANEPDEKVQDTDSLVNTNSGGINKIKQQVRKEYPGDNPLAVKEQEVTEQHLAMSLRNQYDSFKAQYQEAAKKAKPDFLDMDKDGDKKEPMKKAVADKEAKK